MSEPCRDNDPRLDAYVDGEIDGDDLLALREHLDACPPCRRELRIRTRLKLKLADAELTPAPAGLVARIRREIDRQVNPRPVLARLLPMAAAILLAAGLTLTFGGRSEALPPLVAAGAALHDDAAAGLLSPDEVRDPERLRRYFLERHRVDIDFPLACCDEDGACCCVIAEDCDACPCVVRVEQGLRISMVTVARPSGLPASSRRSRDGRDYHFYKAGKKAVIVCDDDGRCRMWIAQAGEEDLADIIFAGK